MNSLNILSARVIGQTPPSSPLLRQRSSSEGDLNKGIIDHQPRRSASQHHTKAGVDSIIAEKEALDSDDLADNNGSAGTSQSQEDEKTPLLENIRPISSSYPKRNKIRLVARRLVNALTKSLKWVLSTLAAPGVYVAACFYDDKGSFSPFLPARNLGHRRLKRNGTKATTQAVGISGSPDHADPKFSSRADNHNPRRKLTTKRAHRKRCATESFSSATSESDVEFGDRARSGNGQSRDEARSETESSADGNILARRSIRIKSYNDGAARRGKEKREWAISSAEVDPAIPQIDDQPPLTLGTIKSPTSPASSSLRMTKYPGDLAPPRPLIPRRQPSYSTQPSPLSSPKLAQKTLVIDLDETLIHSLAKGGRMSSGHMVEVKLKTTSFGGGLGPQHPILYYVHKRPHCDEFLRKVCRWYNLVVFTASVQEYADPVIDWLELERKYFSGRYYRQHCTFRNGAYIKDLSSVEPDLGKVMILDNSPLSYIFHEGMQHLLNTPHSSA